MKATKRGIALALAGTLAACGATKSEAPASVPLAPVSSTAPAGSSASAVAPIRFNVADIPWGDAPPSMPAGAKIAVLEGDPRKPAFFTMRLKLPAGARLAPHTHPADERVTVVS